MFISSPSMLRTALKDIIFLVNRSVTRRNRQAQKYGIQNENTHFCLHAEKLKVIFEKWLQKTQGTAFQHINNMLFNIYIRSNACAKLVRS